MKNDKYEYHKQFVKHEYFYDWHLARLSHSPFNVSVNKFRGLPDLKILEVGVLEGQSTEWLINFVATDPSSKIYCVDSHEWTGDVFFGEELEKEKLNPEREGMKKRYATNKTVHEVFVENIVKNYSPHKIEYTKDTSRNYLRSLPIKETFDIAYLDGAHAAKNILEDLILTWPLMKKGGIVICDDYGWVWPKDTPMFERPTFGIQSFLQCFEGEYELEHLGIYASFFKNE